MSLQYDAIVTLGAGTDTYGNADPESQQRVEMAATLYMADPTVPIIMSGWHSFRRPRPIRPMSAAMKDYAISLGVPENAVIEEPYSLETIGEAYYVKTRIAAPNDWKRLLLVTTDSHTERSKNIFSHVTGPEYTIGVVSSGEFPTRHSQYLQEVVGNFVTRLVLEGTGPGDDEAVRDRLFGIIPGYADISIAQRTRNCLRAAARMEKSAWQRRQTSRQAA